MRVPLGRAVCHACACADWAFSAALPAAARDGGDNNEERHVRLHAELAAWEAAAPDRPCDLFGGRRRRRRRLMRHARLCTRLECCVGAPAEASHAARGHGRRDAAVQLHWQCGPRVGRVVPRGTAARGATRGPDGCSARGAGLRLLPGRWRGSRCAPRAFSKAEAPCQYSNTDVLRAAPWGGEDPCQTRTSWARRLALSCRSCASGSRSACRPRLMRGRPGRCNRTHR